MRLTERAADFLAAGPADVVALIGHICQLPNPPRVVAEHMAAALFAGRTEFARNESGHWELRPPHPRATTALPPQRESRAGAAANGLQRTGRERGSSVAEPSRGYGSPHPPAGASRVDPVGAPSSPVMSSAAHGSAESGPCAPLDLLASLSYVVVDVETTGGRPWSGDRITEVAAVVVRDGEIREVFETLVNPQRPIPPMISALTNITWGMVKDAPVFRDVCDRLVSVMEGHVFVAHNAAFDWRFVTAEIARANGQRLAGRQLCTVRLARKLLPHLRSRSLDHVAHHYGVSIRARHRAGGDALATAHVLLRLLRDARDRGCESWTALEALVAKRKARRKRGRPSAMPRSMDRDAGA
jgi:DNA polymerase-3 subunit epsilon